MNNQSTNHTSFDLSWELKKLGFPQQSTACFNSLDKLVDRPMNQRNALCASAFTVSELFDALPAPGLHYGTPFLYTGISMGYRAVIQAGFKYFCAVKNTRINGQADTMPDAVALAIIHLMKKGKLTFSAKPVAAAMDEEGEVDLNGRTLQETIQTPALHVKRLELNRHIRTLPVESEAFTNALAELKDLDRQIEKATAADALLFHQALSNVGLPY